MPVFDLDAWKEKLAASGVAPELLADIDTGIKPGFLRQDTFTTRMQETDQKIAAANAQAEQYERAIQKMEADFGVPRAQWNDALKTYVGAQNPDGSGNMSTGANQGQGQGQFLTQAQLEAALAQQAARFEQQLESIGQGSMQFTEFLMEANDVWKEKYGTVLPRAEFREFYAKNGHTNPAHALRLFELPYAEKKKDADFQKQLKEAEERGAQNALSQAGIMGVTGMGAGGWAGGALVGDSTMSIGAAASRPVLVDNKPVDTSELTREQRVDLFNSRLGPVLQSINK